MDNNSTKTRFLTWEGEPIYEGDVLTSNDNSRGVVVLIDGEYYWKKDDGGVPGQLALIEKLSPKPGHTLLHKEVPVKVGTLTSVCSDQKLSQKAALMSETTNSKFKLDTSSVTYAEILDFLMEQNIYVTIVPTIVTTYAYSKFNCFRNYEYTITTLKGYYVSESKDGFDTWEDAAIAGLYDAIGKLAEFMIKKVCDEHFK